MSDDDGQKRRARQVGLLMVAAVVVFALAFGALAIAFAIAGSLGLVPIEAFDWVYLLAGAATVVYLIRSWIKDGPKLFD